MQLKIRWMAQGSPRTTEGRQTQRQTDGDGDSATDQRSCHTKRHLPWSQNAWDRIWTEREAKATLRYWTLISFRFAFLIEFHSHFVALLSFSRSEDEDERAIVFVIVSVTFGTPDEMIHIRKMQGEREREREGNVCNCPSAPYVWWVCGSALALALAFFIFCQLMIFIEFSRGKKFAKFAAKCSLLAALATDH